MSLSDQFLPLKLLKITMITQLLISVSIVSLLLSLSSSTLLHYQNLHYFSSNSFHLMTIAMNKNCIFLIFNGILVFLAKTSVLVRPPSPPNLDDMLPKRIDNDELQVETLILEKHTTLDETSLSTEENEDEAQGEEKNQEFEHSNEGVVQALITIEDKDDGSEDEEKKDELHIDGRDEEGSNGVEDVDEIEKLSNEELNKKFEDFIRRMKEEFRINQCQQQQLVLVKY